ncbi:MAG: FlgD immunoglobulin-like domain containing protein [Calditrichia bacterium]
MNNPAEVIELTFHASTNPTGIVEKEQPITGSFQLLPNYPNPFNPETNIPFEIGGFKSVHTNLSVYNILGQRVRIIVNEVLAPGVYEASWDGRDNAGNPVSSGLYFYQLSAGNTNLLGRMILMK